MLHQNFKTFQVWFFYMIGDHQKGFLLVLCIPLKCTPSLPVTLISWGVTLFGSPDHPLAITSNIVSMSCSCRAALVTTELDSSRVPPDEANTHGSIRTALSFAMTSGCLLRLDPSLDMTLSPSPTLPKDLPGENLGDTTTVLSLLTTSVNFKSSVCPDWRVGTLSWLYSANSITTAAHHLIWTWPHLCLIFYIFPRVSNITFDQQVAT